MAKKRRGRNRKPGAREPSGKPQRLPARETAAEVLSVGYEARQRVHNLSKGDAARPEAGTVFGRLRISGEISLRQYEAGAHYSQIVLDYQRAILAKPVRSAGDLDRTGGYDASDGTDPAYREECKRAIERYNQVRRAVLECGEPQGMMVLDGIVIDGRPMFQFVDVLRVALNAVAHALQLPKPGEAA